MKKINLSLIVVLLFMFALASITQAFQNEPEGFRGIKWGDPPGEEMEYRIKIGTDNLVQYERKNDKLKIGGAKLESIEYQFYKGQFMGVWIETQRGNHEPLEDVVKLNFGPGHSEDYFSGDFLGIHYQDWSYQWSGDMATVILKTRLEYYKVGYGYLTIRSTKIYNQYQEDIRRKKEEEARRKEEERQKAAEKGLADFDYAPIPVEEEENKESREALEKPETELSVFREPVEGRRILRACEPEYPSWAEKQGMKGTVEIKFWVLASGEVSKVEIWRSSGWPELDNFASQALMEWRFEPVEEQEIQWGIRTFQFHLSNEQKIEEKAEAKVSTKDRIAFISTESVDKYPKFEVKFKQNGKERGVVIFECDEYFFLNDITIKRGDGSVAQIAKAFVENIYGIREIGTVDLSESGNEDVFLVWWDGGTGMDHFGLNLINTQKCEIVGLVLSFDFQATEAITEVSTTNNFHSVDYEKEREFLESIKYEYGFIGKEEINKQSNNPDFAYYFWAKDNGFIEDGRMNIRRYKGKCKTKASIELKEGNITYTSYFKRGVVAYDEESNEHFILFHPDYMYSYITVLKKIGPYLLIGTEGEGLAVVNVENFHLKRFRFDPPNDYINKLEISDLIIRINDSKEINLPNF